VYKLEASADALKNVHKDPLEARLGVFGGVIVSTTSSLVIVTVALLGEPTV
jgi:hypothetical protein